MILEIRHMENCVAEIPLFIHTTKRKQIASAL